jgi:hypothetical protein
MWRSYWQIGAYSRMVFLGAKRDSTASRGSKAENGVDVETISARPDTEDL